MQPHIKSAVRNWLDTCCSSALLHLSMEPNVKDAVFSTLFFQNLEEGKTMLESYDVSDVVVLLGSIDQKVIKCR